MYILTQKYVKKALAFLFSLLIIFSGLSGLGLIKTEAADESVTLTGFLIDEHCFKGKNITDPGADTLSCKLMKGCIKSGYGIAVLKADGGYKFYYADGDFFTNVVSGAGVGGTGGQKLIYDFVVAQKAKFDAGTLTKQNYIPVTITGTLLPDEKASTQAGVTTTYNIVKVTELRDATKQEATGLPTGEVKSGDNSNDPSPTQNTATKLTDSVTGIAVKGILDSNVSLSVSAVNSGDGYSKANFALSGIADKFVLFDIGLQKNNIKVQPDGKVTVLIPLPQGYNSSTIKVYRIEDDGSKTELNYTIKDGFLELEINHFSLYAVAQATIPVTSNPKSGDSFEGISVLAIITLFSLILFTYTVLRRRAK